MKENNNPEIQETFRFPHSPASKQPLLLQVNDDDDYDDDTYIVFKLFCPLKIKFDIQVYDWDRFSKNDLMGEVKTLQRGQHVRVFLCHTHILYYVKTLQIVLCVSHDELSKDNVEAVVDVCQFWLN